MERLIEHKTFEDNRGTFTAFLTDLNETEWDQVSVSVNNNSFTFRGLHYQTNPPQRKYVKVVSGAIIDFLVDLETLEVEEYVLDSESNAILIPENYAHGFLTLQPDTVVVYMVKGEYNPESEHSMVWYGIPKVKNTITSYNSPITISEKDNIGK